MSFRTRLPQADEDEKVVRMLLHTAGEINRAGIHPAPRAASLCEAATPLTTTGLKIFQPSKTAQDRAAEVSDWANAIHLAYGNCANKSLKSVSLAASPKKGETLKISSNVRKVEPWV